MSKVKLDMALKARVPFVWMCTNDQQRFLRMVYEYSINAETELYVWDKCNGLSEVIKYEKFNPLINSIQSFGSEMTIMREIRNRYIKMLNCDECDQNSAIFVIKNPDKNGLDEALSLMVDFAEVFDTNGKSPFTFKIIILTQGPYFNQINPLPPVILTHTLSTEMDGLTESEAVDILHWFCDDKGISFSSDQRFNKIAKSLVDTLEVYNRRILEVAFSSYGEINEESIKATKKILA